MKTTKATVLLGLAAAGGLLLAACGGGADDEGDSTTTIRTDKGLAVAAIGANFDPRLQSTNQTDSDDTSERSAGAPAFGGDIVSTDQRYSPYAPSLQEGGNGVTVQGYGTASADADSAIIELYFYANSVDGVEPQPVPEPGTSSRSSDGSTGIAVGEPAPPGGGFGDSLQQVAQITEADLQAVIDALVGAAIPRDKIEFIGQGYYDKFSSSATLRATVDNLDVLDAAVQAATNAGNLGTIQLSSTNVTYTVADCAALESAAMKVAAEDAKERGAAFAQTLGVGIGAITGASHYSYSPYGGSACSGSYGGPYPLAVDSVAASSSRTVQVFANISVTYAIQ
jgi:uncharacterized protein YggE